MIFLLQKQFFEKIITEGGRELIVLNPFLDSLCNSAFKKTGLAPGIPKTCFQHPQDIVYLNGSFPREIFLVVFKGQKRRKISEIKHSTQIYEFLKILTAKLYKIYPFHLTWARVIIL
jgi:hypothetical protein